MPVYVFSGKSRTGAAVKGERTAESKAALQATLRREQITASSITEKGKEFAVPRVAKGTVSAKELGIFLRQFSVMIDAGLPLVQCLEILGNNQENKAFQNALSGVRETVETGSTLANAMRQYPKIFDTLMTNMVEAGEAGGILDTILQRLATYVEKAVKLKAAVKSALIYPVAVVSIAVLVVVLLLWKVVPIFANMFAAMEVALPLPTRVVMGMSGFVQHYGILVVIFCVAGFFGLKSLYATPQGRYKIDKLMINLPVFGMILRKIAVARFTRTLGTLITSGVALLEALDITARTSGNAVVEEAILKVRKAIEQGRNITDPLRETEIFPNMVVQMIGVGEQTGAMDAMLSKIADFYEDEVDTAVGDMLTLMEPMIILMLGVSVGGIVISMYMPLFTLIGQLGK